MNPNPNRGFATFLSTLASKLGQSDNSQNNAAKMFESLANERVAKAKIAAEQQKGAQDLLALKAKIGIEALGNLTAEKNRILQDETLSQEQKDMALKDIDNKRLSLLSDLKAFDFGNFAGSYMPPAEALPEQTRTPKYYPAFNMPSMQTGTAPNVPPAIDYDAAMKAQQKMMNKSQKAMKQAAPPEPSGYDAGYKKSRKKP